MNIEINPTIENFLQKHKDLLNHDLAKFFYETFDSLLYSEEINILAYMLDSAGVTGVDDAREKALEQLILEKTQLFGQSTGAGVYAMPLDDFIMGYLDERVGFNKRVTTDIILKYKNLWDPYVSIYKEDGIYIISKKD